MGCKKRAVVSLAVASLLAVGTGFANFALADTATVNQEQSKIAELPSPVRAGFGSWTTTVDATCADVQNVINDVEQSGAIRLTESCAINLVIPSNKTIYLTLHSEQVPEQTPEETPEPAPEEVPQVYNSESIEAPDEPTTETPTETLKPTYASLTNNSGDTITVEEGAVLYFEGSGDANEYLANDDNNGSSIINNHGTTYILSGTIRAVNGAYTFTNDGEINLLGGNYVGNSFRNNDGKVRIAGGTFDNIEELRPYIIGGHELNAETRTVGSILSDEENPLTVYNSTLIAMSNSKLPVGYSFTIKTDYPEYADAMEALFASSDESVIEVTGSNSEGWTFTVTGAGQVSLAYHAIYQEGRVEISSYQIEVDIPNGTYDFTDYLIDNFPGSIQQAIKAGQTISVKLESSKLDDVNVDNSQKAQVAELIGEDKVASYYSIALVLKGNETKLDNITDLGDQTIEIRLATDFVDELEAVAEGYTRSYYVVRVHGEMAEKLDTELDGEELVFHSGKFSTYAVAYADTENTTTPPPAEDDDPNADDDPGTGDDDDNKTDDNSGDNSGNNKPSTTNPGDNTGDNTGSGSNTTNPGGSSNTDSNNNANQNPSTSTTNPSSNGSNSNKPNSGIGVPNTGVMSYYLENDEARIALIIMLVAASVVSSLITAAIVSRKRRK